jgi:isopentenyl diphosphate isomerase/L-lactate dehydrogenase-like FMN-dependent dehydrogenase
MRPRAQTVSRQNGFKSLQEAFLFIDEQYAYVGRMSAGEGKGADVLRALAVGADAVRELARLANKQVS